SLRSHDFFPRKAVGGPRTTEKRRSRRSFFAWKERTGLFTVGSGSSRTSLQPQSLKSANKITAHNAEWPPEFRFRGSRHRPGVCVSSVVSCDQRTPCPLSR